MPTSQPELYIGLMSGTSMDGIDAALVRFSTDSQAKLQYELINTYCQPWPDEIQQQLIDAREIPDAELDSLNTLDINTAKIFAEACVRVLEETPYKSLDVTAIGNHGQTIRHRPDIDAPFSLQIGNAKRLSGLTGIDVISDFRTADIEAGGQGAPLAPAFHRAVFQHEKKNRVIVNIGGIANITSLPADNSSEVIGFDCGPGNTLMDAWSLRHWQQHYDADGMQASKGKTDATLLAKLLMDDYFQLPPPKSTGFEYFNLDWLDGFLDDSMDKADVQSTLCDLTATSIIRAILQYTENTDEIIICGGGVHNRELMRRLQSITKIPVSTTEISGIHPDWVEAMAFAWLAYQFTHQQTGNLPTVTGAREEVILGKRTAAR